MIRIERDKDLSRMNTFGMKVSCSLYLEYDKAEDLAEIDFEALPKPLLHIGGGSNLLFTGDFPGTVMHSTVDFIKETGSGDDAVTVEVGSGVVFDSFVSWACGNGLWGAENLSMIPGEVGAAAVQNIGAYGVEVKDIITSVRCFDVLERHFAEFGNADCLYGYRDSFFKREGKGRYIVTSVLFHLAKVPDPKLDYGNLRSVFDGRPIESPSDVREAVMELRRSKLPDPSEIGSAGSFFKNPVVSHEVYESILELTRREAGTEAKVPHYVQGDGIKIPAAWMIERCALKGITLGGAAVYERQPLVIINRSGDATPGEIMALERKVIDSVREKFGVELHPEVEHV